MTSPLTITYTSPTAPGTTPAAATGNGAPATDNPLGFLAALVDQLLAGGTAVPATDGAADPATDADTTPAVPPPAASPDISALLDIGATAGTTAPAVTTAPGGPLLKELVKDLDALKDQLDAGETPDPDLLKKLGKVADALAALMVPPAQAPAVPAPTPDISALDPLKAIAAANASTVTPKLPDLPGLKQATSKQQPLDQIAQVLASLGFTAPASQPTDTSTGATDAATPVAAAPGTTPTQPLPALAQLADKLAQVSAAVAPLAPEVAQKLQALTQKLTAAETDPTLLAQLTTPADSNGSDLDQIVRTLLDSKPAASVPTTPQLATATKLDVPAEIAPAAPQPTSRAEPKTQVAESRPTTHSSAKISLAEHAVETANPRPQASDKPVAVPNAPADDKATPDAGAPQPAATVTVAPTAASAPVAPRVIPAAYQAATAPINMGQMAFEMVRQLHQGQSRFSIRIDPPELGRVDVKMHVDSTGTVNARLTVERSETLDMFQRDRGSLEKALSQAGLDSGKTNLEFSLKQQNNPFANMSGGDQRQQGGGNAGFKFTTAREDDTSAVPAVTLYRGVASAGGVNLFV